MMPMRYRSSVEAARVKWGATMYRHGHKYDHGLVEIRFRAKVRQPAKPAPKRDLKALADEDSQQAFDTAVEARLSQQAGEGSVEDDYDQPARSVNFNPTGWLRHLVPDLSLVVLLVRCRRHI